MLAALILAAKSVPLPRDLLERPRVPTTPGDANEWARTRRDAVLLALSTLIPPLGDALARRVALSLLAQYAHETGRGRSEFNFNLGGWLARSGDPFFVARDPVKRDVRKFAAFDDLVDAASKQVSRLIVRFPSAWALLISQPETSAWVEELGRRGYYEANPEDYARAWASLRAELVRMFP